jgi:hypothetical protein
MKKHSEKIAARDGYDQQTLTRLFSLPHKILRYHEVDGLAQMILHELGHNKAFNLSKAGYFVDNPDFNCLRGVAGFSSDECRRHKDDLWETPVSFLEDMKEAEFHQKLANFYHTSVSHNNKNHEVEEDAVYELGHALGMTNPEFVVWKIKHGNNGLLLFEATEHVAHHHRDLLHNMVPLLSLC